MRRVGVGGLGAALLAAAGACLVAAPAAARIQRVETVVLEPHLGVALPAVEFVTGTVREDYGADAVSYADALEPAFLGGLHLVWLFPVGGETGRCLLGPETGFDYVVWDPDIAIETGYGYAEENLDAGRLRFLAGARLAGLWDWGWLLGRLGVGPEVVNGWWDSYGDVGGNTGAFLQVGFGLGVDLVDWFAISLLADAVMTFHAQGDEVRPDYPEEIYFGYRSLEFNLAVAFSFLL